MNSPATRRRLAEEGGFTIVEVLVAALILTITALAIATLMNSATHNTFRSEQDQVVVNRLQDEMERIRQLPFNQVALMAKPTSSGQTSDPGVRVSADGTHFDLNRNGTNTKLLAYAGVDTDWQANGMRGTGQPVCGVNPGPEPFQSGDVTGKIHRYIAYPGVPANCPGCSADYLKRIIVIIRVDTTPAGGTHVYQEIQSNVSNPDAVPSSNPVRSDADGRISNWRRSGSRTHRATNTLGFRPPVPRNPQHARRLHRRRPHGNDTWRAGPHVHGGPVRIKLGSHLQLLHRRRPQ